MSRGLAPHGCEALQNTYWVDIDVRKEIFQIVIVSLMSTIVFIAPVASENAVKATLIADVSSITPGETFRAGVVFELPEHAHIYWRNPGDSGLATGVDWILPAVVSANELQWPNPQRFVLEGLDDINHGYESEVLLFSNLTISSDASGSITLSAQTRWLLCLDDGECIPEEADLTLTLPIASAQEQSNSKSIFDRYAPLVPTLLNERTPLSLRLDTGTGSLIVDVEPPLKAVAGAGHTQANCYPYEGPALERVKPNGQESSNTAIFHAPESDDRPFSGVLTIPVQDSSTGETNTFYIRVDNEDTSSR